MVCPQPPCGEYSTLGTKDNTKPATVTYVVSNSKADTKPARIVHGVPNYIAENDSSTDNKAVIEGGACLQPPCSVIQIDMLL